MAGGPAGWFAGSALAAFIVANLVATMNAASWSFVIQMQEKCWWFKVYWPPAGRGRLHVGVRGSQIIALGVVHRKSLGVTVLLKLLFTSLQDALILCAMLLLYGQLNWESIELHRIHHHMQ